MREQRVVLKDHADAALVRRDIVDRLAAKFNFTMRRCLKAGQHHKTGRLARAGRPEHGHKFARLDFEVQVFDDKCFAVIAFLHIAETYKRVGAIQHSVSIQPMGHSQGLFAKVSTMAYGMARNLCSLPCPFFCIIIAT